MQKLQSPSLKNNLYQIQLILVDVQPRAYNFMIKGIVRGFSIFNRENKTCYVSLPIPYIGTSLSRDHQTVIMMNLQYIILNEGRGTSCYSALMGNFPICSHMS